MLVDQRQPFGIDLLIRERTRQLDRRLQRILVSSRFEGVAAGGEPPLGRALTRIRSVAPATARPQHRGIEDQHEQAAEQPNAWTGSEQHHESAAERRLPQACPALVVPAGWCRPSANTRKRRANC